MENGIVKPMLRSLLISYVLSGLLLGALAFALYKLRLKEGQVNLMVYLVYLAACLAGGAAAGKRLRQRRFFWGLLSGLFYFLILFAVSWAMNPWSALDTERSVTVMAVCAPGKDAWRNVFCLNQSTFFLNSSPISPKRNKAVPKNTNRSPRLNTTFLIPGSENEK